MPTSMDLLTPPQNDGNCFTQRAYRIKEDPWRIEELYSKAGGWWSNQLTIANVNPAIGCNAYAYETGGHVFSNLGYQYTNGDYVSRDHYKTWIGYDPSTQKRISTTVRGLSVNTGSLYQVNRYFAPSVEHFNGRKSDAAVATRLTCHFPHVL